MSRREQHNDRVFIPLRRITLAQHYLRGTPIPVPLKCHSVGKGTRVPTGYADACGRTGCAPRREPATVGTWQKTARKRINGGDKRAEEFLAMLFMQKMIQPIERNASAHQRVSFRYDHFAGGRTCLDRTDYCKPRVVALATTRPRPRPTSLRAISRGLDSGSFNRGYAQVIAFESHQDFAALVLKQFELWAHYCTWASLDLA